MRRLSAARRIKLASIRVDLGCRRALSGSVGEPTIIRFEAELGTLMSWSCQGENGGLMTSNGDVGSQGNTPAGWYPDPQAPPGAPQQRYWDGSSWTSHVAAGAAPTHARPRRRWPALLAVGAGVVAVALIVGVLVGRSDAPPAGVSGSTSTASNPEASSASPATEPSRAPTPDLPQPETTVGKPVMAALARYVRAYKGLWETEGIDPSLPLGPQLEPRSSNLRDQFAKLVAVSEADPGALDPASNFGALLRAIELEVEAIEGLVADLLDCTRLSFAASIDCEIAVWEDQRDVSRAARRVQAATELVNLPDSEDLDSESVSFAVEVGECYIEGQPFRVVDCSTPHDGEVFATYEMPDTAGLPYPGEAAVEVVAQRECKRRFEGYVGVRLRFSELLMFYVYPSPESWSAGQRTISCLAQLETGRLRESIRGSGR